MGSRGNIKLDFGSNYSPVYLYTHWRGYEIKKILRDALVKGASRWDDAPYLARIIFSVMTYEDDSITGYGLSPFLCDNEYDILHVDLNGGIVIVENEDGEVLSQHSFDEFVKMEIDNS